VSGYAHVFILLCVVIVRLSTINSALLAVKFALWTWTSNCCAQVDWTGAATVALCNWFMFVGLVGSPVDYLLGWGALGDASLLLGTSPTIFFVFFSVQTKRNLVSWFSVKIVVITWDFKAKITKFNLAWLHPLPPLGSLFLVGFKGATSKGNGRGENQDSRPPPPFVKW